MKQEDKELLLRDLCARLPYEVKCEYHHIQYVGNGKIIYINRFGRVNVDGYVKDICDIKPYLFPMSSMTEEQREEYDKMSELDIEYTITQIKNDSLIWTTGLNRFNWLLKHHFDIYGLIPKGLAKDATGLNIY